MAKELAFKALFYLRASKLTHGLAGPSATTTYSHEPNCVFLATGKRLNENRLERYHPPRALGKVWRHFWLPQLVGT